MIGHRCHRCLWFDNQHKTLDELENKDLGYCRKHKPVVFANKGKYYGGWPLVDINDFCGEFREDK